MNQKQILSILGVILVVIVAVFVFFRWSSQGIVELKVLSDKASYKTGEEINLALSLKNTGKKTTCVSNMSIGSIGFVSLTRNGTPVESRSTPSYFITSFPLMLENSLVSIKPGENLEIVLKSEIDSGLGKQALKTTGLVDGRGVSTFYDVETSGDYNLELVYKYIGPVSSDCAGVFNTETNKAVVEFTIAP